MSPILFQGCPQTMKIALVASAMLAALTGAALATPPPFLPVPGPEAGAALPMLAVGAYVAWRLRRNAR